MKKFGNIVNVFILLSLLLAGTPVQPVYAAGLVVNTNADNTTAGDTFCTLREAITNANSDSDTTSGDCAAGTGNDTITFATNYTITLNGAQLPDITDTDGLTITGNGAANTIVQGAASAGTASNRVFRISSATVTLEAMTIRYGVDASGGGINNAGGSLTLNNVVVSGNQTTSLNGGGISTNGGSVALNNSTVSGNQSANNGGGIFSGAGTVTINNSTISGNSASGNGGGIYVNSNTGTINLNYSTVANNTSDNDDSSAGDGGGVGRELGTFNLKSSIVAGNKKGISSPVDNDCTGTLTSQGYNLTGNSTGCTLSGTGDMTVTPSTVFTDVLGLLADNGGSTYTHALLTGSVALDQIPNAVNNCGVAPFDKDQRSNTRPVNIACDIGAYESQDVLVTIIVTKTDDTNDGTCDSDCSLREAIANAGTGDTVTFDSALSGGTINLASTLTLTANVTIDGSVLALPITISGDTDSDGTGDVRVFYINSGVSATLDNLIIKKGRIGGSGGGIQNNGTLTVMNSTISDNAAVSGAGGGIRNDGTLTVTNSTFSGNSAIGGSGGGIRSAGALTVTNSTFSDNSADGGSGGGIYSTGSVTLTVTNSTFSANMAGSQGGGIYYDGGTFNYANTIIANSTGGDCAGSGTLGTNTNNLVEDASCSASLSNDPNLDSLADNGGSTLTFGLIEGSPAIDSGDDTTCAATPVNNLDQRGVARPVGAHCDIGAYEGTMDITPPATVSFARQDPASNPTNANVLTFRITFSEAVTGVSLEDFDVTGGAVNEVADINGISSSVYDLEISGEGELDDFNGVVGLDFSGTIDITDLAGNPLPNTEPSIDETYTLDNTLPTVDSFTVPSSASSLNIPITAFTASDNDNVTGYLITESSTAPSAGDSGWTGSAPTTYTVGSSGIYTLYPWAKDAAGNVSAVYGSPVSVTVTTTLTFKSTAAQDGWILESSETSGNGGTMNSTATLFYLGDNAQKKQYRSILSFTTSSLPDNAIITKVTLKLKRQGITGGGNPVSMFQGFMADVKKGMFGTAPLALADFKATANKTVGPQSPALTTGWYSLNLTPAKAYINKLATNSGLTQIRLRFKLDDNNNAVANFLKLYSGNAGTTNHPQLIVEYYVP